MDFAEELVTELPWLRKMACLYCRCDADADDLVSDTVERLWRARHNFDGTHAFRSLAYKVMQNVFINLYRRRKSVSFVEQFPAREPATNASADAAIRSRQLVSSLRRADRRSVCIRPVILYALGYSYQEISEMLGIPMGTVQRRIHEGRKQLKKELGE